MTLIIPVGKIICHSSTQFSFCRQQKLKNWWHLLTEQFYVLVSHLNLLNYFIIGGGALWEQCILPFSIFSDIFSLFTQLQFSLEWLL